MDEWAQIRSFRRVSAIVLSRSQTSESFPKLFDPEHIPESQTDPRLPSRLTSCKRRPVSQQVPIGNGFFAQIFVNLHLADPMQTPSVKLPSRNE